MPFAEWIRQYECCFPIATEHPGTARLHIVPRGYEKDKGGRYNPIDRDQVYGLYVTGRIEDDRKEFKYAIHDFVVPKAFQSLEMFLADSTSQAPVAELCGEDGRLQINFEREAEGQLKVICYSPSCGLEGDFLRVTFEFTVNAESLIVPRKQIRELLELIEKFNSADYRSSGDP